MFDAPHSPESEQENDKCNTSQHNATLSPPQVVALEALLSGKNITAAARAARVSRFTIHRWLKDDKNFRDAYHEGRADLAGSAQNRLLNLTPLAIKSVQRALKSGNPWIALFMLRHMGSLSVINSRFHSKLDEDDPDFEPTINWMGGPLPGPEKVIRVRPIDATTDYSDFNNPHADPDDAA
jgi:hypothetical protein